MNLLSFPGVDEQSRGGRRFSWSLQSTRCQNLLKEGGPREGGGLHVVHVVVAGQAEVG